MPEATPVTNHPTDRLIEAVRACGAPVCVGIDPVLERLPKAVRGTIETPESAAESISFFTMQLLEAVAGIVPCVKFQSACFERYGAEGIRVLESGTEHARSLGLQVIFDAKRGDIGISNEHYAHAFRGNGSDWITLSGYLGVQTLRPYLEQGRGAFVLVRTSNPEGSSLQSLPLIDGRTVAEAMADLVVEVGDSTIGDSGYSNLGVVVGATQGEEHHRLRERMPRQVFLVPGYGAQGGELSDILDLFHADGMGAMITASRSVIYAANEDDSSWMNAVRDAAGAFADEIGRAVGLRTG